MPFLDISGFTVNGLARGHLKILVLEMFPIVLSVAIWADRLANSCVLFHTDNMALLEVINKKTTKDKELLILVRALVLYCLRHIPKIVTNQGGEQ